MAQLDIESLIGYDVTFELNDFSKPRIRSEIETVLNIIMAILFMKPGQYPSLPLIGMDIGSRLYSFYDEIDPQDLKDELISQCDALSVHLRDGSVGIRKMIYKDKPTLLIHIEGIESYPNDYMQDTAKISNRYYIGITYDELNRLIYNIAREGGT